MIAMPLVEFRLTKVLFWVSFFILSFHLLYFVGTTAGPYLQNDGWFFVSDFLIPFYNGDFEFGDFYLIRGAADHVQPLHRILFFINAKLFDLDFRYEAVFGAFFVVLIARMMCLHFQNTHHITELPKDIAVGMLAIVMLVFSLNSINIYTWSLVTIGFIPLYLNIGFFIYLSNLIVKDKGSDLVLIAFGAIVLFVGDDGAVLVMVVAGLAVLIAGFIIKKKNILKYLFIIISMVLVYQLYRSYMIGYGDGGGAAKKSVIYNGILYYLNNWGVIYKVIIAPFSDGFLHRIHLKTFPGIKEELSLFIGFSFMFLHLYTWYAFFKYKLYKKSYLPVMLMLYSYVLVAGIMIYRIPNFGADYMHQPRYIKAYQIGLWGCVWGLLSLYSVKSLTSEKKHLVINGLYFAAGLVLIVQLFITNHAWNAKNPINAWHKKHAANIIYYSGENVLEKECTKVSSRICRTDPETRKRLIGFLKEEKLNVFSERIRKDYLY